MVPGLPLAEAPRTLLNATARRPDVNCGATLIAGRCVASTELERSQGGGVLVAGRGDGLRRRPALVVNSEGCVEASGQPYAQ